MPPIDILMGPGMRHEVQLFIGTSDANNARPTISTAPTMSMGMKTELCFESGIYSMSPVTFAPGGGTPSSCPVLRWTRVTPVSPPHVRHFQDTVRCVNLVPWIKPSLPHRLQSNTENQHANTVEQRRIAPTRNNMGINRDRSFVSRIGVYGGDSRAFKILLRSSSEIEMPIGKYISNPAKLFSGLLLPRQCRSRVALPRPSQSTQGARIDADSSSYLGVGTCPRRYSTLTSDSVSPPNPEHAVHVMAGKKINARPSERITPTTSNNSGMNTNWWRGDSDIVTH